MAHTRLLFALVLLLSAISCSGPASPQAGTSPTPAGGAPSPTPVTQTVRPAWPTQVDSLGTSPGTAAPYAVTQGAVYGLWDVSTATATPFAQPAGPTKSAPPTIGQPIAGAAGMAAAGGWVWVVTNPGASASAQLYQLNRNSLTVVSQRSLPVPVVVLPNSGGEQAEQDAALAAAPPWLWVAAGADLFRVDAATGSWTGPFPEGEELSSISTDPSGRVLYTSGETATGLATVREYSASTGSLLRQVTIPGAIVAPEVAAAAGGVWVGYTTGLRGGAELLSSQTLTRIEPLGTPGVPTPKVPSPEAPTPRLSLPGVSTPEVPSTEVPTPEQSSTEVPAPEVPTPKAPTPGVSTPGASTSDSFDQIGGVNVSVSDGALWLSGQSSLSCADPRTAAVGASETVTSPPIVVAADGVLYASDAGALDVVSPPAICFG